jgi:hypothetical protein
MQKDVNQMCYNFIFSVHIVFFYILFPSADYGYFCYRISADSEVHNTKIAIKILFHYIDQNEKICKDNEVIWSELN